MATPANDQAPPPGQALPFYAKLFYDTLLESSTKEILAGESEPVDVFRGKIMEVFGTLGVGNNYYSRIRRILVESGAIEYAVRGTRGYESVLLLNHPPPDDFTLEDLTDPDGADTVPLDPQELDRRLASLEDWRETAGGIHLGQALKILEERLSQLEEKRAKSG